MNKSQSIVLIVFMVIYSAYASARVVATSPHQAPTAEAASVRKVELRVQRNRAEVKRLRQDVAAQEAHSEQATERLKQQDQVISALRRQLQELQAAGKR